MQTTLKERWIIDSNADGYADDIGVRLRLNLPDGGADRAFWSALFDVAARLGLQTHALPLPLVVGPDADIPPDVEVLDIRTIDDIPALDAPEPDPATSPTPVVDASSSPNDRCLTDLFTIRGMLLDRDDDQLPDDTRVSIQLPDYLPTTLGIAVANLAARIGLETGGITFPFVRDDGTPFRITPGSGPAALRVTDDGDGGWEAGGDATDLAALLESVARDWPHLTAPETGGVGSALATLRRWLAGDGPEPNEPGDVIWEQEWSDVWECDALLDTFGREVLQTGLHTSAEAITVFASEPLEQRERLADRIRQSLAERGAGDVSVTVLSAFKAGLSWLCEVVIPALEGQRVARLRVEYARMQDTDVLDLPIRWLQELFPGNEIAAQRFAIPLDAVELVEMAVAEAGVESTYRAEAFDEQDTSVGTWACNLLPRRQPFVAAVEDSGLVVVTTGGIVVHHTDGSQTSIAVPTDLERFWSWWQERVIPELLRQIDAQGGPRSGLQPFFGELLAEVWVSEPNAMLGVREENDSAAEALAEDIYFTTLDAIELFGTRQANERCNAPGAIIPLVHVAPGSAPRARITLRSAPARPALPHPDVRVTGLRRVDDGFSVDVAVEVDGPADATVARLHELAEHATVDGSALAANVRSGDDTVRMRLPLPRLLTDGTALPSAPSMTENVWGEDVIALARSLAAQPEVSAWIEDRSYQGRPLVAMSLATPTPGRLHSPTKAAIWKPTYLIVARHHANEISSTNAAFRLAWLCANDPDWRRYLDRVNILILPYENPDGAALHVRLASETDARRWKHHPARYNALGYEFGEATFDPDTRFGEARVRSSIWRRWPADVVVDNHGVPSHEWIQPFAGFGSPPRFQVSYWVVQALLYGIVRWIDAPTLPHHRVAAEALRDAVSARVRETDIGEFNRIYGASYRFWGQSREPERFPGVFHDDMLWHIDSAEPDPEGRGFAARFPRTTVLNWVTEVNDETAEGEHLERVARAHLLANQATLDLLAAAAPDLHLRTRRSGQSVTVQIGRERPLLIGGSLPAPDHTE